MAVCLVAILVGAFFYFKKPEIVTPTVTVAKGSITEQAEAVGHIKTRNFSTVKSQVEGIVEAIYHEEGEYVIKNTPLIKVKPTPEPVQYAEAYKNLLNDMAEEKHKETHFKRQQQLLEARVIPANHQDYITAQKEYDAAKNQRVLSEQKLALLTKGETVVAGQAIANVVNSPIDGYILYRGVNIGDPVISVNGYQTATPLFVVANMQELIFQGLVDERDAAKVKPGMVAKIKIGSLPDQEITGTISRVALQSDKENSKLGVAGSSQGGSSSSSSSSDSPFNVGFSIEIANLQLPKDLVLRSGYSATASIEIKKVNDVLTLPMRVIQFKDTKPYVLLPVKNGKKPQEQPVEVGISDGINIEIKSGLKFGVKVVDQNDTTVVTQNQ